MSLLLYFPRYGRSSVVGRRLLSTTANLRQDPKTPLKTSGPSDIVFIEGVRTPFLVADYQTELRLHDLARRVLLGLTDKLNLDKNLVGSVVLGNVIQNLQVPNVARDAALCAAFPATIPAHTVNMACISSNQAITSCIAGLSCGHYDLAIAGGVELMSEAPVLLGRRLSGAIKDVYKAKSLRQRLVYSTYFLNPFRYTIEMPSLTEFTTGETMGFYADRMASSFKVTRAEQDEYASRSHHLARKATDEKLLTDIIPLRPSGSSRPIEVDNGIRPSSLEVLGKLKPAFVKEFGTVTAANSSFLTDGAAACLLTTAKHAKSLNLTPKAYLRDFVYVAQHPKDELLMGPIFAIPRLLQRNGLKLSDIDVFELHEAFAAQTLSTLKALDCDYFCKNRLGMSSRVGAIPMEKLNQWGGSLSLGHPLGATGVRLVTMAINRLRHQGGRLALVSSCAAGGLGHAMLIEAC